MAKLTSDKRVEIAFITIFSVLILITFYVVVSMNGVVLGNDPAVHLEKAKIFLDTGKIPLANLGWTPPLYEIVLSMFISLSGATDIGQLIFLVKALAALVDWMLFMAVYLLGSKFFSKKVGAVAAVLLLMCVPMFEVNQWGGYTSVLGIAFLFILLLYLPLSVEKFGYLLVTFFAAFSVVLSHQLATFLAVIILPPILVFMLIKLRGAYLKVLIALIIGGGIAFFLYYFQAMIGYLGIIVEHVFFSQKTYAFQIPYVSLTSLLVDFGFLAVIAVAGFFFAYKTLRAAKKTAFFVILFFSFMVPLVLAESYVFGLYLPFYWFIYYLVPTLVVLAAVTLVFSAQKLEAYYLKNRASLRKNWVKVVTVSLVLLFCVALVFRSNMVYGKMMEASVYYSTTDIKAYDAGIWLRDNYPQNCTVVVTQVPGFWFQEFSGKTVIAQTDPIVERNTIAEAVLSLAYEVEHPQTLFRAYEAKGDISSENYVSIDNVWNRVSYSSGSGDFLLYSQGGVNFKLPLSSLSKTIVLEDQGSPKKVDFLYSNENVSVAETVVVGNDSYPLGVSWSLTPLRSDFSNATLYLSTFFDLKWSFDVAEIPGLMDWVNPHDAPAYMQSGADNWVVASFSGSDLKDNYLGLYDDHNDVAYAFRFNDLPDWGNIGALGNRQIDAVRFQYQFSSVGVNETVSRSYEVLTLSKNSYGALAPSGLMGLFDLKVPVFTVTTRDFSDYIKANDIGFIVYDRNQLDTQMVKSKLLQLVYSNDRYVIFKITNQPLQ